VIIIKTPQPDTEERLVLVPLDACNEVREDDPRTKLGAKVGLTIFGCHARDATPADLARAGYGKLPMWVTSAADGQRLIGERDEARAAFLGCAQAVGVVYQTDGHADEPGPPAAVVAAIKELTKRVEEREADMHVRIRADYDRTVADSWRAEVAKVERGRDALVAILAKLFGWDDDSSFLHAFTHVENAVLNLRADLSVEQARAEKAEREREEAKAGHTAVQPRIYALEAELARREAIIAETWDAIGGRQGLLLLPEAAATIRHERDEARAELARLTAAVEGEPSGAELRAIVDREGLRIGVDAALVNLYRLGVAHERARHAPAQDRATDEELMALASNAHRERIGESVSLGDLRDLVRRVAARVRQERCLVAQAARGLAFVRECQRQQDRATDEELGMVLYGSRSIVRWDELADGTRAEHVERARVVAARVRQERCLVAQAVAANVDIRVCEDDGGGFMLGVHESGCDEELARCVPAADVPATLARLLGEVSRG